MGALCCCFHVHDEQDNNPSNDSTSNNCWFFQKITSKLRTEQLQAMSSSANQQAAAPSSNARVASNNNSNDAADASHSNVAPAFSQEIGISRSSIQLEPSDDRIIRSSAEQKPRNMYPSLDDEESCPTCFEEYNEENPKTVLKCTHHYHLSCIYEWMERSASCPACQKLMLFQESN